MLKENMYTGKPCKFGHIGIRLRSNRACVECGRNRLRAYQASERGIDVLAAYNASQARRDACARFNKSEKGAAAKARYAGSEKQKAASRRAAAKPKTILARSLRNRVRNVIKRGKGVRAGSAIRDLGCSLDELKLHIAGAFLDGMTWENYGEWHLDHIKPLAAFDLSDREQFLEAVHYTNLQPLWALDNYRKAARIAECPMAQRA